MQKKTYKAKVKRNFSNRKDTSFFPFLKEKLNYIIIDPGIKNLCACIIDISLLFY